jgi:hypothetical protein
MKIYLTSDRANELLTYDKETGRVFRNKQHGLVGPIGCRNKRKGYLSSYVDGKPYQLHRVIWLMVYGSWPSDQIDHINGIPDDNRLCNLREATNALNAQNKRKPARRNKSGLLGVSWLPRANKWRAQVQVDGKPLYLGLFSNKHEAHQEYLNAKRHYHAGCTI